MSQPESPSPEADVLTQYVTRAMFTLKSPPPDGSEHYRSGWDDGVEAAIDKVRDVLGDVFPDVVAAILLNAADSVQSGDVRLNTEAAEAALKNGGPFALIAYAQLAVAEHLRSLAVPQPCCPSPEPVPDPVKGGTVCNNCGTAKG